MQFQPNFRYRPKKVIVRVGFRLTAAQTNKKVARFAKELLGFAKIFGLYANLILIPRPVF